jgi:hypothetical protein
VRGELTRRSFIERAGLVGLAAALAQLPELLDVKGLLPAAAAQSADVVEDTLAGLIAFIFPGDDEFSRAQGDSTKEPGGLAAGTLPAFIRALDDFVPVAVPGDGTTTLPASGGVATLLNRYALEVNPAAASGAFLSPFARLSNAEKAKALQLFESDPSWDGTEFKFVSGILPGFVAFMSWSEAGVLDPQTHQPRSRPVGWTLSRFGGPAEGHAELRGYYHGHRAAIPTRRPRKQKRQPRA